MYKIFIVLFAILLLLMFIANFLGVEFNVMMDMIRTEGLKSVVMQIWEGS